MEIKKDLSLQEMMQLTHDFEELKQTDDMIRALSLIDVKDLKSIKK